ncbi:30S ribosomal protein S9 [candidate division WWE3 bacterium CG10_big_fil_rev_8_21_14_0_10_32_10]|uniref:30S ribosomal protein S9 n=1 Tax=candidate division WWE3 bacterium CG10_big_fil_rev_8_21_14_0_10_32_10 TaxID=1975090 RepID=A0A2H0RB22_UNCKA|nr:MAG: 30S ribosomal protein S9 [candidate division WWE3 bacterium CG10_big_fil_rev_8_21_14_0_10_32_10]
MFSAVGRRKRSVARVWLYPKKGEFLINDKPVSEVYPNIFQKLIWVKPFHIVGVSHPKSKFSATIKTHGGGISSQVEAIQLGITRALIKFNPEFKDSLKKAGLPTRDPREVERKKTSQPKARKKVQYSKR